MRFVGHAAFGSLMFAETYKRLSGSAIKPNSDCYIDVQGQLTINGNSMTGTYNRSGRMCRCAPERGIWSADHATEVRACLQPTARGPRVPARAAVLLARRMREWARAAGGVGSRLDSRPVSASHTRPSATPGPHP